MEVSQAKEFAESLRIVADFYEANPTLTLPWNARTLWITIPETQKEELIKWARAFGVFNKSADSEQFCITRPFGMIGMEVSIKRNAVCTAKVIGTKTVTKKTPIAFKEETVEEDIIEWECPKSIMKIATEQNLISGEV